MKKLFLIFAFAAFACNAFAQKAVFTGKFAEMPSPVMAIDLANPMGERLNLDVKADGTFTWEFDITSPKRYTIYYDEPHSGFNLYVEPGLKGDLQIKFVPKTEQGMDMVESQVEYTGDYKDVFEFNTNHNFYEHQTAAVLALQANPKMTFSEFRAMLRHEVDKGEAAFMKIGSPTFRKYMKEDYEAKTATANWWYIHMNKDTKDEQFAAFAESVDHNNPADITSAQYYAEYYKVYCTPEGADKTINFVRNVNNIYTDPQVAKALAASTVMEAMSSAPANIEELYAEYAKVVGADNVSNEVKAVYEMNRKMVPGAQAVDFDFYDRKGKKFTLSKLKGKAVYFDMWATWCGPCCAEIPNMAKLAEHYKDSKDVQIVSVSLDKSKDKWLKKITTDKLQWPQYIVKGEFQCVLCKEYRITGIPRFMMFDKNGRIISIDAPRPSDPNIINWIDSHAK